MGSSHRKKRHRGKGRAGDLAKTVEHSVPHSLKFQSPINFTKLMKCLLKEHFSEWGLLAQGEAPCVAPEMVTGGTIRE